MLDPTLVQNALRAQPMASEDVMLAEHAHRVANDMANVIAEVETCRARLEDPSARDALAATVDRLHRICELQRRLIPPDCGGVDLGLYLADLADNVVRARSDSRRTRLSCHFCTIHVDSRLAWHLGTAVVELLTNACKHGLMDGEGHIQLALRTLDGSLVCAVADDGVGSAQSTTTGTGHGFRIVEAIAELLNGAVERRRSTHGTEVYLSFPLSQFLEPPSAGRGM